MSDPIDDYLVTLERHLAVHPRRRDRIIGEIEGHLRESAQRHGVPQAIARMGPAAEVARSFTPGVLDWVWHQRDRLAALALLAAMIGSLPLALELWKLNGNVGRSAWLYFAFLAPTTLVAVLSALLTVLRRPAGRRLVTPLAVLVAVTAVVTLLDLPPAAGVFDGYVTAVRQGYETGGCDGRSLAVCAADHADEIRFNYTAGALLLMAAYAWAVAGWSPRRMRRHPPDRELA